MYEACTAAGLDLWKWETGGYPPGFMAKVIVWYELHGLVRAHAEEAASHKSKG